MTSLVRFNPSSDLRRMQREFDRLFDGFFPTRLNNEDRESAVWTPRVDLAETEAAYLVHVDVPGMRKEDFTISYEEGVLTVSGERKQEIRHDEANYVRIERSAGRFFRSFNLPKAIDADKIEATYTDGVLDLTVPKAEETKPRRIEVR
ncbi:MAG: Hsp20/alpha crystallin family protein [Bacteroidota bacterium]